MSAHDERLKAIESRLQRIEEALKLEPLAAEPTKPPELTEPPKKKAPEYELSIPEVQA